MRPKKQQRRTRRGHNRGPEPRVVAIRYRPVPDAEARLRRLAAILLGHATRAASQAADEKRAEVR